MYNCMIASLYAAKNGDKCLRSDFIYVGKPRTKTCLG